MKKLILILALLLTLSLLLCACNLFDKPDTDTQEPNGEQGAVQDPPMGDSTAELYAKAQELGFEGTLEEFLALCKGVDGITPRIRINEESLLWEVSYDEGKTWESTDVSAQHGACAQGHTPGNWEGEERTSPCRDILRCRK